jgi:DNA-binding XRE family transcriptional regulator
MNKTELTAKKWLEMQGHKDLVFQHSHSPDFITNKGEGFEVKLVRQNTITFSSRQWGELQTHPDVTILIFNREGELESIVKFKDLTQPPSYWNKYRLVMVDLVKARYMAEAQNIKNRLENLGITQSELARLLGVSFNTVSHWKLGEARPSKLALRELARMEKKLGRKRAAPTA